MSPNPRHTNHLPSGNKGFSLIELLVVLTLIAILSAMSLLYLTSAREIYKPDDQSLKLIDILQEARQRSLTQRETMRVEIDLTDNVVRLIDENTAITETDDNKLKEFNLLSEAEVRVDIRPSQISNNPPENFPVPSAYFRQSIYPQSLAHDVCTIRFLSNGTVVDQGSNEVGENAVTTGLTLHVWSPKKSDDSESEIARAITIIGSTGSIRLWEHDSALTGENKWKDTRRTSIFGGQSTPTPSNSNINQ
jgi:prepilin-type N-terminal cleavage/methylation domain-containing protein